MTNLKPVQERDPANKVLVVFAFGKGLVVCQDVDDGLAEYIVDCGGSQDPYDLDAASIDYEHPGDGIWIGCVRAVDDGPSDWPGARETAVQLRDVVRATEGQWLAHLAGDWPW